MSSEDAQMNGETEAPTSDFEEVGKFLLCLTYQCHVIYLIFIFLWHTNLKEMFHLL